MMSESLITKETSLPDCLDLKILVWKIRVRPSVTRHVNDNKLIWLRLMMKNWSTDSSFFSKWSWNWFRILVPKRIDFSSTLSRLLVLELRNSARHCRDFFASSSVLRFQLDWSRLLSLGPDFGIWCRVSYRVSSIYSIEPK
jgi:hypothetical protein